MKNTSKENTIFDHGVLPSAVYENYGYIWIFIFIFQPLLLMNQSISPIKKEVI